MLHTLLNPPVSRQVPGLIMIPEAFTPSDELDLLSEVDASSAQWTKRRTRLTKNYGPFYMYTERDTAEGRFRYTDGKIHHTALPPFLYDKVLPIVRRSVPSLLQAFEPNQLHVALYDSEDDGKIHMHNDNKMGELGPYIVGMCLLSDCHMTFTKPGSSKKKVIKLPRRCVYVMSGEAHREWRHGILSGNTTGKFRVSFTLRSVGKLAVEEGVKVAKSAHQPSKQKIDLQKAKDAMKAAMKESAAVSAATTADHQQTPQQRNEIQLAALFHTCQ